MSLLSKAVYRPAAMVLTVAAVGFFATPLSYADESGESGSDEQRVIPVVATSDPSNTSWEGANAEVNQIQRSESSNYTSLTWSVRNNSQQDINFTDFSESGYVYEVLSTSGVTLLDEKNGIRYYPYIDSEEHCVCSGPGYSSGSGQFHAIVQPEGYATYWDAYKLSEDTTEVTVEIPGFLPIQNVPVE
ncbi:hypothetical protein HDA32_004293 [Spinactinospora alkalitolerans]|uniref:Uncharacterized protein n=1 Tax=Spinactinospora alkalitolerans TaxID=687207 RepID=A0A852U2K2_9ACTN|nr:hypothetical protein [Spinactinospora alkalitolerans]NYE49173.1 hypothetical protein [Spinactinospora alkalitolerans]